MINKEALHNHVTPIPYLLAHFYRATEQDVLTEKYNFDAEGFPNVGDYYRANTSGFIFVVDSIAVSDEAEPFSDDLYPRTVDLRLRREDTARIILKCVEPDTSITLYVSKQDFFARIPSDEHYAGLKAVYECNRYEKIDKPALTFMNRLRVWHKDQQKITPENLQDIKRRLEDTRPSPLYVLNTRMTRHGLPDILIEFPGISLETPVSNVAVIPATWLPIDLTNLIPRKTLATNSTVLKLFREGALQVISERDYKRLMKEPAAQEELKRVQEKYTFIRNATTPSNRPSKASITNPEDKNV